MSIKFRLPRSAIASRLKRGGPIAAALMAALVLVPTASSGNYTDASGDNGSAGDITGVTIAADKASGQILFRIAGTNVSTSPTVPTFLLIDSDANPLTGEIGSVGADYIFAVDDKTYWFGHWNGSDWADTPDITVRVTGGGAGLLISVNRSELGNANAFNFWVRSYDSVGKKWDNAPDDGAFNYSIALNGPDIRSIDLQTSPATGPRAGKKFVVTPMALKLPPNGAIAFDVSQVPESYSCTATLAKGALRGTGKGGCTLAIPKAKSAGKTLSVKVTVNYQGAAKAFTYTFKVR
jgi:hypothetical protein